MSHSEAKLPPLDHDSTALFLDLDRTLAERAGNGAAPEQRTHILRSLVSRMEGRVAVLTGRVLSEADRILEQSVAAIAAVHGLEMRASDGAVTSFLPSPNLPRAMVSLRPLFEERPGVTLEDKGPSLAVHYREAPEAEAEVQRVVARLGQAFGLVLQDGAMACELRTPGPHKGDALKTLHGQPPFAGFRPVVVGDDLADEAGFIAAEALGGYGVLVGPPRSTRARYRVTSPAAAFRWLEGTA